MPSMSVAQLAQEVGGVVVGDGARLVSSCNTLQDAGPDQVSLLHNAKYAAQLETTRAGCVLLAPGMAARIQRGATLPPLTAIEAENTYFAWQQTLVKLMGHRRHASVGISPHAAIHPTAKIGANANIHPFAVIGENVTLGDNVNIFSHVTLMHDVRIGNDTTLYPGVTVYEGCIIGNRCLINAGTVIGSDGVSYAQHQGVHHKVPQSGNVILEDDVEIAPHTIVERAVLKSTIVQRGTKMGCLNIIGHNCNIGPANMLISHIAIAGSTTTGKYVVMGGQVGINGHLDIPDFVKIGAQSGVLSDPRPNTEIVGTPAMESVHARRVYMYFTQLPELAKRLKELEKLVARLTDK